jgi:hypothetical protein
MEEFHRSLETLEQQMHGPYLLFQDGKSKSYYTECHPSAGGITEVVDLNASLDPDEQEEYRINREMLVNHPAFTVMQEDARKGRQFSDIIAEWNTSYSADKPIKILGGQHRCESIIEAADAQPERCHGFRIYFGLTKEQRVEIARISNTSIAVSNDLLDRMSEGLLGTELRDWCQEVELLDEGQDFADRRSTSGVLTVGLARALFANYILGASFKGDPAKRRHSPHYKAPSAKPDDLY